MVTMEILPYQGKIPMVEPGIFLKYVLFITGKDHCTKKNKTKKETRNKQQKFGINTTYDGRRRMLLQGNFVALMSCQMYLPTSLIP
jgi:hypothetical protein